MQCECDDTIDDPKKPSKICKKHFAWVMYVVAAEREEIAKFVHDRLGADGYGVAQMIRDRNKSD